ncbi:trypsin-like serine peptidase [Streptomyces sp. NPDC050564]|uniref:trypsin-like serine peptidase n=1 Tax=Streptomyces sp. NPDC050564 TaxID=3365631 RepID=UPI003789DB7C
MATAVMLAMALIPASLTTASAAEAPTATATAAPGVTVGKQTTDPNKVRAYWTSARIKRALANEKNDQADIARDAAVAAKTAASAAEDKTVSAADPAPHLTAEAPQIRPAQKTAVSTMAAAADMSHAEPVPFPESTPAVVVGKIVFIDHAGNEHGCSGASIAADGNNTVWTAGHCVHPGDGSGADGFYDLVVFIPGYKKNSEAVGGYDAPWGEWVAKSFVAPNAWTQDKDFNDADMAAFTVEPAQGYTNLTATVGALGYKFGYGSDWSDIIDSGFPGEGYQRTDMDGYTQYYCTGNVEDAADLNPFDNRLSMDCDMGAGASGGPMVTSDGQIVGANSHVETDANDQRINDNLYSSDHGDNAVAVINQINELN